MKRIAILILLCTACADTSAEPAPRSTRAVASEPLAERIRKVTDGLEDMRKQVAEMNSNYPKTQEVLDLGRDTHLAKQELIEKHSVVFFMQCIERHTGEKANGAILEHHVLEDTREARACVKEFRAKSPDELFAEAIQWGEEQRAKSGQPAQ